MVTFYRRMPKFDYIKPKSIDEAIDLLAEDSNGKCRVYAGGTDLIPRIKGRSIDAPKILVDLKGISNLDYIEHNDHEGLRIGPLATISSVAANSVVKTRFPILSMAAGSIASNQVRNRGTIAGNICNAVPSADSAPALLCLGARLILIGKQGEREVGIEDFFTGPSHTTLKKGELLKEIRIPDMPENSRSIYIKLSTRKRMDLAIVGVGAVIASENEIFRDVRIGLGAVAPTPIRAVQSEEILKGKKVEDGVIANSAKAASEEAGPIDDHRASAEYRKIMVEVLVKRAINTVLFN